MKLFHKIFLCFIVIFGITFQAAGYLLINFAYGNAIRQEKNLAFQDFQYNRYILQSILYSDPEFFSGEESGFTDISGYFTVPVALYGTGGDVFFSNLVVSPTELDFDKNGGNFAAEDDRIAFQILGRKGENYIFVCDYVSQGENGIHLVTQTDISSAIDIQKNMIGYFQRIYIAILCVSFPVIFLLTKAVTAPIQKVGEAARRIAGGEYSERISAQGRDEISELASDFNQMADQVEEKIAELSRVAKQKEDFAANFAHELKTPLTSVIGYADMICHRELSGTEIKSAAGYILNEGMRLESLSLKLMELFVLDRQNFSLERMSVREIFQNLEQSIWPVCAKRGTKLHMDIGDGYIKADYDFFATMMQNLVDNAIKADSKDIWICGEGNGEHYRIEIRDNGRGIPPAELDRITEAFYMVDKSRSRRQHGAGLGLALVSKIVEIHGATLEIESDGKAGTVIRIIFCAQEEYADE